MIYIIHIMPILRVDICSILMRRVQQRIYIHIVYTVCMFVIVIYIYTYMLNCIFVRPDLKPVSRTYFALATKPAEQFPYFSSLVSYIHICIYLYVYTHAYPYPTYMQHQHTCKLGVFICLCAVHVIRLVFC